MISCTAVFVPLAISTVIKLTVLVGSATCFKIADDVVLDKLSKSVKPKTVDFTKEYSAPNIVNIENKEYETVFIDSDLLLKTIKEQGAVDIEVSQNSLSCRIDSVALSFTRDDVNQPFKMKIIKNCNDNCDGMVSDINSQYGLNLQEESYNKITERLKKSNMQISQEEVLEDNSIMLTVDID